MNLSDELIIEYEWRNCTQDNEPTGKFYVMQESIQKSVRKLISFYAKKTIGGCLCEHCQDNREIIEKLKEEFGDKLI